MSLPLQFSISSQKITKCVILPGRFEVAAGLCVAVAEGLVDEVGTAKLCIIFIIILEIRQTPLFPNHRLNFIYTERETFTLT